MLKDRDFDKRQYTLTYIAYSFGFVKRLNSPTEPFRSMLTTSYIQRVITRVLLNSEQPYLIGLNVLYERIRNVTNRNIMVIFCTSKSSYELATVQLPATWQPGD